MADFNQTHWALLDLQYEYLDTGFKLTATTDVPCHLYCRMTTTPPQKHSIPSFRRGLFLQGDIRFCFVVYEDNEQDEAGDTLTHTWNKTGWAVCETRWFYFVGTQGGAPSVSETAIFTFHFPAPPPEPPPPMTRLYVAQANNRTINSNWGTFPPCWNGMLLNIQPTWALPGAYLIASVTETISWRINRGFLTFDTSNIPFAARIISAKFFFYPWFNTVGIAGQTFIWVTLGHQSNPVVIGDWFAQNSEDVMGGELNAGDIVLNTYNSISLNSDGFQFITKSGITRLCIRQKFDVINFQPPPLSRSEMAYYSNQKGAGYRPYLEIVYYPA